MVAFTNARVANQRAIVDRAALIERLDDIARTHGGTTPEGRREVLVVLKETLANGREEIKRRFDADEDNGTKGLAAVSEYSFLIDQLIRVLYDFAFEYAYPIANPTSGERKAVVAVGGYGRGELAPQSDIDLLFLLSYKLTPHTEQVIEYLLYMLWDLGLKVGHATRSIDECVRMAKQDHTIRTALLESRYLWGDSRIFQELRRRFREQALSDSGLDFVESKLLERDERHKKLGDSRYLLEPNVKDGKGGLRDLHTLFWIAKYLYQVEDMADLVGKGVFTKKEAKLFERAHAFLTTVRCHLHYLTGRPEDRLTFDVQPTIGRAMHYTDHRGTTGVERFMKHYYLVAKDVGDLTRIFCAALEAEHKRKPLISISKLVGRKRDFGAFEAEGRRLNVRSKNAFDDDPVNILRLFHVAQENALDIHPAALRLVTRKLGSIDQDLREDPEANRLFIEMLTSRKEPATTLRRLNEAGVFGRFVPDFGRVVAQMQHDMYHVFTVDEHTIRAVELLHKIEVGEMQEDHPLATESLPKVTSRRALYVAVLLHDIAKGRGGDHSVLGAEIAEKLGPRFGLSDEETETVAWLVRWHLAMSVTAQKRDIDDAQTIRDFSELVQSPERLRLLLVLTVVDMRATGPHVWNSWKAALLRELYYRVEENLAGTPVGEQIDYRVRSAKEALAPRLADLPPDQVAQFFGLGYPAYWLAVDTDTQEKHARMWRAAVSENRKLAIEIAPDPARGVTEVTIYAPDHPGLFSLIAGAMALAGANIVDARIFTLTNGQALDTFLVQEQDGSLLSRPERVERLRRRLHDALTGEIRPRLELAGRETLPKRMQTVFQVPPRVLIDNNLSRGHTVIEVNGRDRPGLLHDVTRALTEIGLQIATAKITTYGERVVDVFYVKDVFGMKIDHPRKLEQIRVALLKALGADPEDEAHKDAVKVRHRRKPDDTRPTVSGTKAAAKKADKPKPAEKKSAEKKSTEKKPAEKAPAAKKASEKSGTSKKTAAKGKAGKTASETAGAK